MNVECKILVHKIVKLLAEIVGTLVCSSVILDKFIHIIFAVCSCSCSDTINSSIENGVKLIDRLMIVRVNTAERINHSVSLLLQGFLCGLSVAGSTNNFGQKILVVLLEFHSSMLKVVFVASSKYALGEVIEEGVMGFVCS